MIDIVIAPDNKTPLFKQIKEQIKDAIHIGSLKQGDPLPSIRQLAKDLHVSVITTKRAYEELEKEAYVVSTIGKGTFVGQVNDDLLKEWQMRSIENDLELIVERSKRLGLSLDDLNDLIAIYYKEDLL